MDTAPQPVCKSSADCPQNAASCSGNTCVGGQCVAQTLADGAPCSDGNPCTAAAACSGGKCAATKAVICSDGNPCSDDACDKATGNCVFAPVASGKPCDDGNPCTAATVCDGKGQCSGGSNSCACKSVKDCAAFDDGNPCNGTLYCNDSLASPQCQVLPTSVVPCDTAGDSACSHSLCDPKDGQCKPVWAPAASACDDGNACTVGESCQNGACQAPVNLCQCQVNADCAAYEDGNACNGTLYCDKASGVFSCKINAASVVACPKPTDPCKVSACDAKTGKCQASNAADGTPCDDSKAQTTGDACQAGACVGGTETAQCLTDKDCAKLEDGDYCNGVLFCNKAAKLCQLNPKTVVQCPTVDDTACQKNLCQPQSGLCKMTAVQEKQPCDDGDLCTVGEVCQAGKCTPSADTCLCKSDADCKGQDDGNLCNGILYCQLATGTCKLNPATVVNCPTVDDGPCAANTCNPKTGACAMAFAATGTNCDDGDACTASDACQAGKCGGTKVCACSSDADCSSQEDGNLCNGTLFCNKKLGVCAVNPATVKVCPSVNDGPCATNQCVPATGQCQMAAVFNGAACNADSNPCTANDWCDNGACKAGKNVCECYTDADCTGKQGGDKCIGDMACDKASGTCKGIKVVQCDASKDTACQKNACNPATGACSLKARPDNAVCGDGGLCAAVQVCQSGQCVAGKPINCDDADACSADSCDPKLGCAYKALTGTACDDGNVCTSADQCLNGQCGGTAVVCNDNNPCTQESCDPAKACVYLPVAATPCNDSNACTVNDACQNGVCAGQTGKIVCSDGNPCTKDGNCAAQTGCYYPLEATGTVCDDGNACTAKTSCSSGACTGSPLACDDGDVCTLDGCDKAAGCTVAAQKGKACNDGNACTVGDACTSLGLCASATPANCDDALPCTFDLCQPQTGCLHLPAAGIACDDKTLCTSQDQCQGGACVGSPINCDDANPCSVDGCDAVKGCTHLAKDSSPCDDNNACTGDDNCTKGACSGTAVSCEDGNPCTVDVCDKAAGCKKTLLDFGPCDDGSACTTGDHCKGGVCTGDDKLWSTALADAGASVTIAGVLSIDNGASGYLVVGTRNEPGTPDKVLGFKARYDANGTLLWNFPLFSDKEGQVFLSNMGRRDATSVLAGGYRRYCNPDGTSCNVEYPFVTEVYLSKADVPKTLGAPNDPAEVVDIADRSGTDTSNLIVGTAVDTGFLARWPGATPGNADSLNLLLPDGASFSPSGVCLGADKTTIYVVGWRTNGGGQNKEGFVVRVKYTKGAAVPDAVLGWTSLGNVEPHDVVCMPDNSAVAVGFQVVSSKQKGWAASVSPTGTVAKVALHPSGFVHWTLAQLAVADGSYLLLGGVEYNGDNTKKGLIIAGLTPSLDASWQASQAPDLAGTVAYLTDLAPAPDNGYVMAIASDAFPYYVSRLARVDAFTNGTCAASGGCYGKTGPSCDDGNVCTIQGCTASAVCGAAAKLNSGSCGTGKTCSAGVCK